MNKVRDKKLGIVLSYLTIFFNTAMTIVYTPYLISRVGDNNYGVLLLANSSVSMIALLDLGLGNTTIRYVTKYRTLGDEEKVKQVLGFFLRIYSIIAVIATIVGILTAVFYPKIGRNALTPEEISLYRVVLPILLVNTVLSFPLGVFMHSLNAFERFTWLKGAKLFSEIATYATLFFVLSVNKDLVWVAAVMSLGSLLLQLSYFLIYQKEIGLRCSFEKLEKSIYIEILAYAFYIFINTVADFLYAKTDRMILGGISGAEEVSVYSVGVQFYSLFTDLAPAISAVFFPSIIESWEKGNAKKVNETFLNIARMQMMAVGLMIGGFVVFGADFIHLWVGETYNRSYVIGLIIIIPAFVPLTQTAGAYVLRAMNIQKYRSYMYLFFAVLNLAISIPMAFRYGGVGAAIGTLISTCLGQIVFMNWFYAKKAHLNIMEYWKDMLRELLMLVPLSLLFMLSLAKLDISSSWVHLIAEAAVYTVIYCILYYVFVAKETERAIVKKLLARITGKNK